MPFSIFINNEVIGTSELESGDPPMGVVHGILLPTNAYKNYKDIVISRDYAAIEKLGVFAFSEAGERLEPCIGVGIEDFSEEAGETMIQVSVLGLDRTLYEKYFSDYIEIYENQFKT